MSGWEVGLAVGGGVLVGVLSGLVGVGGGILFVPLLVIGFGFPQRQAQGTSLVAILPTALVGAVTHMRAGNVLVQAGLVIGTFGMVGAVGGAATALHVPQTLLARIFAIFLLVSAWRLWPAGTWPKRVSTPNPPVPVAPPSA